MAPAVLDAPRGPDQGGVSLIKDSVSKNALTDEVKRTVLREAEDRYRNEIASDEERMLLQDRIKHIRRQLMLA